MPIDGRRCPECGCPYYAEEVLFQLRRGQFCWVGCKNYDAARRRVIERNVAFSIGLWHWASTELMKAEEGP